MNKEKYNAYHKEYQLKRYHERRRQLLEKLGGKCVVCQTTEELEIDHKEPIDKRFNLAKWWGYPQHIIDLELSKCQLLCKAHHLEKSIAEKSVEHGRGLTGKNNCQCDLCAPLKRAWTKEWRKTHPRKSRARS